jgi:hypothetical protein
MLTVFAFVLALGVAGLLVDNRRLTRERDEARADAEELAAMIPDAWQAIDRDAPEPHEAEVDR